MTTYDRLLRGIRPDGSMPANGCSFLGSLQHPGGHRPPRQPSNPRLPEEAHKREGYKGNLGLPIWRQIASAICRLDWPPIRRVAPAIFGTHLCQSVGDPRKPPTLITKLLGIGKIERL